MDNQITNKQHYVVRHYLRAWTGPTNSRQIWTYIKDTSNIAFVSLMGVGQATNFYKMHSLSESDKTFINGLVEKAPSSIRLMLQDLKDGCFAYSELKKKFDSSPSDFSSIDNPEDVLKDIEINTFEKIHGMVEKLGFDLLACKNATDVEAIYQKGKMEEAILFLCVQYCRTKAMFRNMFDAFKEDDPKFQSVVEHAFPFLSFDQSFQIARSFCVNDDWKIQFVTNDTEVLFITGDQPIINTAYDETTQEGLELYYPISPRTALVLSIDEPLSRFSDIKADRAFVKEHNDLIFESALHHVFSLRKDELEQYKTH